MKQFCGTSDCALDQSYTSTASATTTSLEDVEQSSSTIPPTSDPLNVVGQVGGVVISVMIVSGIIGNVLVLTVIVHCPQLRRSYNAFIASLSVTDLIFNVAVMPFYVDSYIHRRWRFSDAVCRWHTYFGTIVIVSSSLHIALIASSRYHLIVHPRFYARWLSSGVAVISQIVFVWLVAVALVLPGISGVLPTVIGYSDQLSRCSYDRVASYGALSFLFCTGFIVPCVVMGYCYAMIWRRTREVAMRVDGYGAVRLLKIRQQNGELVFASNCPSQCTPCVNAQETARMGPLPSADNDGQLHVHVASEDDKIIAASEQSSDKSRLADCVMEHPQGTTADCPDALLSAVNNETISVAIDHLTAVQSRPTTTERRNTANCSSCNNSNNDNDDEDVEENKPANEDELRRWIKSTDCIQLATTPFSVSNSGKPESSSSGPSMSRRSCSYIVEREDVALDYQVTNDEPAVDKPKELERPAAETQTLKHDSIRVVVSPATASSSAATILRESPKRVVDSAVTGENHRELDGHLQHLVDGDVTHLSATTQRNVRMSPFRRRLEGGEVGESSPPVRLPSPTCHRHRSHSLHMILAVFFAFVLTYLPFTITNLADQQAGFDRNVYMMTSLAFWAGSCINPLIYGIMNVQFRRAYVSIVVNCWRHSFARCQKL